MLYKIEIPIENEYYEEIWFMEFYFEKQCCPTKEEVIKEVKNINGEFAELKYDIVASLEVLDDWPELHGPFTNGSAFCNLSKYGKQKLTISKINTIKL